MDANLANPLCRRISGTLWLFWILALLAACGGGGGGGEPARVITSVMVTSLTQSPIEGQSVQLTAVARDQFGDVVSDATVAWASSDPAVATISSSGLLQAQAPGPVVATAAIAQVTGSLPLTVAPRSVASVSIVSPTTAPKEGDEVQLTAVVRDQLGNTIPGAVVAWSSSNTEVAVVSAAGVVSAYAAGDVVVTARANGTSGTVTLSITPILVEVAVGAKELVFDYTTDRCEAFDVPDQPVRFVRAEDSSLVLVDGNAPRHYLSRGPDFTSLQRDCSQPALVSRDLRTPESYENWEWLWVVYREGSQWHGLIHNEFHDAVSPTCAVGNPSPGNPCWYNSITYAASVDGGKSFSKPLAPAHVVAPAPNPWVPPPPGVPSPSGFFFADGYRAPTSIVRGPGGYYYSLIELFPSKFSEDRVVCVMRTDNLHDPASWRAWDGNGFDLRMTSPYVTGETAPLCTGLKGISGMGGGHLVFSTYLQRYFLVAPTGGWIDNRSVCGFFYSLSADLVHWSAPRLLVEAKLTYCPGVTPGPAAVESFPTLYPSLVDHADTTANFERIGTSAYLYYTRFNDGALDRDLVRVPLTFTRVD